MSCRTLRTLRVELPERIIGNNNNGTTFKHVGPRGETRGDTAEEVDEGDTSHDVFLV